MERAKRDAFFKSSHFYSLAAEPPIANHRHRLRVLIGRETYRDLHGHLLNLSAHRPADSLRWEFWNMHFETYGPIRKQLLRTQRQVNA